MVYRDENDLQYMFLAYLDTALRRQRMKYIQRLQNQVEHEFPIEEMDQIPDPYSHGHDFCQDATATSVCACLPERDRRIVQLHVLAGVKLCAIAGILDMSVSATQKAYQRALAKMRVTAMENA